MGFWQQILLLLLCPALPWRERGGCKVSVEIWGCSVALQSCWLVGGQIGVSAAPHGVQWVHGLRAGDVGSCAVDPPPRPASEGKLRQAWCGESPGCSVTRGGTAAVRGGQEAGRGAGRNMLSHLRGKRTSPQLPVCPAGRGGGRAEERGSPGTPSGSQPQGPPAPGHPPGHPWRDWGRQPVTSVPPTPPSPIPAPTPG